MSAPGIVGKTLGHYRLLEQIGQGGMGVVFRARDERLDRDVAVKILPAGTLADDVTRRQFRREALALSAVNHPNIATVHDFHCEDGLDYLVTEYVPGQTLDQKISAAPLGERELLDLAVQLAEGLAAAHAEGIIHRDLKPANLRITPEGRLKILDFGLAKRQVQADAETRLFTDVAPSGGTLPYMPPEQLRGDHTDARSDLWSAGVALYEAATGKAPFAAKTASGLAGEILHADLVAPRQLRPELSGYFERVLLKCLEKQPDKRYQSAGELLMDLHGLGSGSSSSAPASQVAGPVRRPAWMWIAAIAVLVLALAAVLVYSYLRRPSIQSVAVLPFVMAGNANSDFIADGLTEELINALTQVPGIKVIARPTMFTYKGREVSPRQVGKDLGVGAVVLGRLAQTGADIVAQVDIVDTSDGSEIWGGQLRRPAGEVQSIQHDIALQVAAKLRLKLSGEQTQRMAKSGTQSSAAYEKYLRGRFCLAQVSAARLRECLMLFQQATEVDPAYAQAWAGLADAYAYLAVLELEPPIQVIGKSREAAMRALQIDSTVAEAHTSLALIALFFEWDMRAGEKELKQALQLNPGDIFSRHIYAHFLEITGNLPRAHEEMRKVMELDPTSNMYTADVAYEYHLMRQPEKIVELSRRWTSPDSMESLGWLMLALAYVDLGRKQEAIQVAERVMASDPSAYTVGHVGMLLGRLGEKAKAEKILADLQRRSQTEYIPAFSLAAVSFGLGKDSLAFTYLKEAYEQRSPSIMFELTTDPVYDPYRADPRFIALARQYNVPVRAGENLQQQRK